MNIGKQLRHLALPLSILAATALFPRTLVNQAEGAGLAAQRGFAPGGANGLIYQSATAIPVTAYSSRMACLRQILMATESWMLLY